MTTSLCLHLHACNCTQASGKACRKALKRTVRRCIAECLRQGGFNTGQHGMCVLAMVHLDELCQPCLLDGLALPYQLVKEHSAQEGSMKSIVHGPPCWVVGAAREGRCQGA